MKTTLNAHLLTERVHRWLKDSQSTRILGVFKQACNLINECGEVLSVVTPEIGPGPFNLVVKKYDPVENGMDFPNWVKISSRIQTREEWLSLGAVEIDLSEAQWWDPTPDWNGIYRQRKLILRNCRKLIFHLVRNAPSESLIHVLKDPSDLEYRFHLCPTEMPDTTDRVVKAAFGPIQCLMQGMIMDQISIWEEGVQSLAGLGGGLTPAGDDFILGTLYALRVVYPQDYAQRRALRICELAAEQTSHLSAAYLQAATRGEAVQLWHILLESLISSDETAFREITLQFRNIGYTSGFDALAGFMCVLLQSMKPVSSKILD